VIRVKTTLGCFDVEAGPGSPQCFSVHFGQIEDLFLIFKRQFMKPHLSLKKRDEK